jgi:hypothetical protein
MTQDEAIKALQGEPMHDRQGIVTSTTGGVPPTYTIHYHTIVNQIVDADYDKRFRDRLNAI